MTQLQLEEPYFHEALTLFFVKIVSIERCLMEEIQNGDSQSNDHKEFDFNVTGLDFILNISLKEGSWRLRVFVLVTFANPIQKKKKGGTSGFPLLCLLSP